MNNAVSKTIHLACESYTFEDFESGNIAALVNLERQIRLPELFFKYISKLKSFFKTRASP